MLVGELKALLPHVVATAAEAETWRHSMVQMDNVVVLPIHIAEK